MRSTPWVLAALVLAVCGGCGQSPGGGRDGGGGGDGGGPSTYTLSLTVSPSAAGQVKSTPNGIDCGEGNTACSASFNGGTSITLAATPQAGGSFLGWTGGGCSGTGPCTLTLRANTTVTAQFQAAPATHTLTVNLTGSGGGVVTSSPSGISCPGTCGASFSGGTTVTLTAAADGSSTFAGWTGACSGTSTTCTVTLGADTTVTADFEPSVSLSVSVTGNGAVTSSPAGIDCPSGACSQAFATGTQVTLTATPTAGNAFTGWGGDCGASGTAATCTLTLAAAKNVTATFQPILHTLSVTVTGTGTVTSTPSGLSCASGTCTAQFAEGTVVSLAAAPGSNVQLGSWGGACSGSGACSVTMSADESVSADFVPVTYTLSVAVTGNGTVTSSPAGISCTATSGTCSASFVYGTTVTLAATGSSSQLSAWGGACSGTGACSVVMGSNQSVTASFVDLHTLTVTVTGPGTVTGNGGQIACTSSGGTCSATYVAGTSVTLTATPDSSQNALFQGFGGDCSGTSPCTVTLGVDRTVSATFAAQWTLAVGFSSVAGGTITSSPTGINSPGTSSALFVSGTTVTLTETPTAGYEFTGWSGDCSGTAPTCTVTMSAAHTVYAAYSGPFDFTLTPSEITSFSMLQGETRSLPITVTLTTGAALPVTLSVSGLPTGVTGSFSPSSVTPNGTANLVLTASANATVGDYSITVKGASSTNTHTVGVGIDVRSPDTFDNPRGVAIESGGATALVTEGNALGWGTTILERVDTATRVATKTISSNLPGLPGDVALAPGGTAALVDHGGTLSSVDLATGAVTDVATGFGQLIGVSVSPSGTSALVTDQQNGTVTQIDLATGTKTPWVTGLTQPASIVFESGGTSAILCEKGAGLVVRATSAGTLQTIAATYTPDGIAMEQGGTSVLISDESSNSGESKAIARVDLTTGTISRLFGFHADAALAIEASGTTALAVDAANGRLWRVNLARAVTTLAPAYTSTLSLAGPMGVAIESGGTTALVTDAGSGTVGRLLRADLTTGSITQIANVVGRPEGVAVESGGTTALVAEYGNVGNLVRIDLSTGAATNLAASPLAYAEGVAIEAGGATALVSGMNDLWRVDLATGAVTTIATFSGACGFMDYGRGVAIESGGTTALMTMGCPGRLVRVDLSTGALTTIATGFDDPRGVAIESTGTTALVAESGMGGRLWRVDLSTGRATVVQGSLYAAYGVAVESSGTALVTDYGQGPGSSLPGSLLRVGNAVVTPTAIAGALQFPTGGSAVPSLGEILFVDCNGASSASGCTNGRLAAIDESTGAVTDVATGLVTPTAVADVDANTALVADLGGASPAPGRVLKVTLSTGATSVVMAGLPGSAGSPTITLSVEPSGTSALIADSSNGAVYELNLSSGGYLTVATGLNLPLSPVADGSGSAYVADRNGIEKIDLTAHTFAPIAPLVAYGLAIEPGGTTALALEMDGNGAQFQSLVRVDLTTGALESLSTGIFDLNFNGNNAIAIDPTAGLGVVVENRGAQGGVGGGTGAVLSFPLP